MVNHTVVINEDQTVTFTRTIELQTKYAIDQVQTLPKCRVVEYADKCIGKTLGEYLHKDKINWSGVLNPNPLNGIGIVLEASVGDLENPKEVTLTVTIDPDKKLLKLIHDQVKFSLVMRTLVHYGIPEELNVCEIVAIGGFDILIKEEEAVA